MRISRTRFQLALWFAGTVLIALTLLNAAFYFFLSRDARSEFTENLVREANAVQAAIYTEVTEPDEEDKDPLPIMTSELLADWPGGETHFLVYGSDGTVLGARGPTLEIDELRRIGKPSNTELTRTAPLVGGNRVMVTETVDTGPLALRVVAARSTASLEAFDAVVKRWMFLSIPAVSLLAVLSGYLLARRSMRPIVQIGETIATIAPDKLATRLPVRDPPDEVDQLAGHFNSLLERLADTRKRNRRFLAQVAHQIRTPLTLVRGESQLSLDGARQPNEYVDALRRIGAAADQMTHRVNDLFLLAHAEAGEVPPLTDRIELDGLVFECTDLMRGRAQAANRTLEMTRVNPDVVRGNQVLLREAVVELLENALRHSRPRENIRVSALLTNGYANLNVSSAGDPLRPFDQSDSEGDPGVSRLGLSIVRWIAEVHKGELSYSHNEGQNQFTIRWPSTSTD